MKAWQLDRLGGTLSFKDIPVPEPRPEREPRRRAAAHLVRIEASSLMSYLKDYVEGKLPHVQSAQGGVYRWG